MKVAVAGAGLAGLSLVWHLVSLGIETTLFDPKGIGGGASGVSTGLLHPFPGKKALRSWESERGIESSFELFEVAERALERTVVEKKGIFRPAVSEEQKKHFRYRAENDKDASWEEMTVPGADPCFGLWIPKGVSVYSRLYLEGLWLASQKKGAVFKQELLNRDGFDLVIFATGHETTQFEECRDLPLKAVIGQTLICRWKEPLAFSIVSQGHITPTEDPSLCQVGSTYEHTDSPDPAKLPELIEKIALFYPPVKTFEIVETRSGFRTTRKEGYKPIAAKVSPNAWVFTGLGSRGMLYHAWIGKAIAEAIYKRQERLDFKELMPHHVSI